MNVYHLYRIYNAKGTLIYIGLTTSVDRRVSEHRKTQAWADEIVTITSVQLPAGTTRATAEAAERKAIANELPLYNIASASPDAMSARLADGKPRIAYSLKEVAKLMGIAYTTAVDMAHRGDIELLQTQGRRLLVPARWVDQLRSNTGPTAA